MKKFLLCLVAVLPFLAPADDFVFATNGVILCAPRALPSSGIRLDTRQLVVGLYAASDADRAACGWFRCVDTNVTPAGMVVSNSWRAIVGNEAVTFSTYKPYVPLARNWDLSKYKLLCNLKDAGLLSSFTEYLGADASSELKLFWDASTTLDSTNALVQAAVASFIASGVDASVVTNLILNSRVKGY